MLLYVLVTLILIVTSLYYYFTRTFNYWKKRNVVGPKPVPFFGNVMDFALRKKNLAVATKEIYDSFPNEKIVGIFRMTNPSLLIRDPEIIKRIFIKDFDNFVDRGMNFSEEGLGTNLFHADVETWRILRNRFTPLFTPAKLKNMFYLITKEGDKFVNYLENHCIKNPEQETYKLFQRYAIASISACAFGLDIEVLMNKKEVLDKMDNYITTYNITTELDMMFPGILKKIKGSLYPMDMKYFFFDLVNDVIKQRNGMATKRNDFMDLLIEMKETGEIQGRHERVEDKVLKITENVIAAQAFVFYAGGYVTTSNTLSLMLYQLALNPDIQTKLIAEIDEVLQRHNGEVTYDNLKEMSYLEQVLKETLRMYPIVDKVQRTALSNYKIPGTDVTIEKGTTVLTSILGMHHDEKYFPNPDKFDPERFSAKNINNINSCAYIPFDIGPRNCIGLRFAIAQSSVCAAKMLFKFRVEPSKKTEKILEFEPRRLVLLTKSGIYLNIIPRNK